MSELAQTIRNLSWIMAVQVGSKILTASLNFLIASFVSPEVYSSVNISLQFYYTLILFFSRECLRRTVQRSFEADDEILRKYKSSEAERLRKQSSVNLVSVSLRNRLCYRIL